MTDGVLDAIHGALDGNSVLALPLAVFGGVLMALNPCCVVMYPAVVATCFAPASDGRNRPALLSAVVFVLGAASATTALGVIAAAAGQTMTTLGGWPRYVAAAIPLVMGCQTLGWLRIPLPRGIAVKAGAGGLGSAFITGFLLTLIIGSCGTPILAAILSYAARGSLSYGGLLLFCYGLGVGVPTVLVGAGAGGIAAKLRQASGAWVNRAAGVGLLALGFYLLWTA